MDRRKFLLGSSLAIGGLAAVAATGGAVRKAEAQVDGSPDDLTALEWDEACREFSAALISGCNSPRLIDLHRKFFDQSRRFRLALLREGQLDFNARRKRQDALLKAVLDRDTDIALGLLAAEIAADFTKGA